MAETPPMWVILKTRETGQDEVAVPHCICESWDGVERVIANIERHNSQYPMRRVGELAWRIGPEEDEGFFGHKPMLFQAFRVPVRGALA